MLEALHPGRIDLGIGRAPGTDQATAQALHPRASEGRGPDDFPRQLTDLLGFFTGSWPENHPYRQVHAVPGEGDGPDLWLLGSSGYSAQVAGALGLPFAFAHHFMPHNTLPALDLYRSSFRPSEALREPYSMLAAGVVCADTDERAKACQETLTAFWALALFMGKSQVGSRRPPRAPASAQVRRAHGHSVPIKSDRAAFGLNKRD